MSEFIVDLDAFARNLATIRERVAPAQHMLVVKDDAYAHGLAPIVERAVAEGVTWIGALDVATGRQVRDIAGSGVRVFAWMLQGPADIADAVAADLDCGIGNAALLEDVALAAAEHPVRVHLKIDTGLHRNGVRPEQWPAFVARASELEAAGKITVAGIWSHIAEASDAEDDESRAVFDRAVADARAVGLDPEHLHLAASAAAFARPEFRYTMTRIGAFAYGIRSTDGPSDDELGITPIGTLTATVTAAHAPDAGAEVPEGEDQEPSATIDVGFGALSSLYRGKLRVSHDGELSEIAHVSVSDSVIRPSTAQPGDTVAVFGGSAANSATDLAERIGTIGEEVILRISPLIPRRYTP